MPVLRARWLDQPFVHWPFPPALVQELLPPGLVVDQYDDQAWVSFTPFLMADVRPLGLPVSRGLDRLATFPETNLRTYVKGPRDRDGLWFLSLDVASPVLALAARTAVGAPYHLGDLSVTEHDGTRCYAGTRRGGNASYQLRIRPGARSEPSDHDVWLTSRWRAYTRRFGMLLETAVQHEPWPLCEATIVELRETLTAAAGLRPPAEPLVHYSTGVRDVRIGVATPAAIHTAGRPT